MKLSLVRSNLNPCQHSNAIYGFLRTLFFFSTRPLTSTISSSSSSSSSAPIDSLYRRITRAGNPKLSMVPILEQWLDEGKHVKQSELQKLIKQLRKHRRFTHALQISKWMSDEMGYNLSPGDVAVHLDLISKVHGLEQAEKYFDSILDTSRNFQVYGALLNCYANNKCLEKAEAVMQKIREMGFAKSSLNYNVMLNLYFRMRKHEKLDLLLQEMEEKRIRCDMVTFNIRLNAYAATANIEAMEKLLMKMEADPQIIMDWNAYGVAANGYLKAGLTEKSIKMLKKLEQLIGGKSRKFAYENLLSLYANVGNKDEVYRVWNLFKNTVVFLNSGYLCMISALVKLDDIDGAERIWEEWDSRKTLFDIRIQNLMITAYSRKGLWEKAEACVDKIIENGIEPNASTWDRLATGYNVGGQVAKVAETIRKAISSNKQPGWKPNMHTLASCLEYLKGRGDVEVANELFNMAREHCHLSADICERLIKREDDENSSTSPLIR